MGRDECGEEPSGSRSCNVAPQRASIFVQDVHARSREVTGKQKHTLARENKGQSIAAKRKMHAARYYRTCTDTQVVTRPQWCSVTTTTRSSPSLAGRANKVGELVRHHQTCDAGRGKGSKNTRAKRRKGQGGHVSSSGRCELTQDTNLNTERANVAEPAESVGGDELGSGRQVGVVWVRNKGGKGIVLILRWGVIHHSLLNETLFVWEDGDLR